MELVLAAIVVGAALAFVAWPLVRPTPTSQQADPAAGDEAAFASRRQAIYDEILELELDRQVGKLSDADFRELSEAALERAASVLAEADASQAATDEHLEREIASVRESLNRARGRAVAERERS